MHRHTQKVQSHYVTVLMAEGTRRTPEQRCCLERMTDRRPGKAGRWQCALRQLQTPVMSARATSTHHGDPGHGRGSVRSRWALPHPPGGAPATPHLARSPHPNNDSSEPGSLSGCPACYITDPRISCSARSRTVQTHQPGSAPPSQAKAAAHGQLHALVRPQREPVSAARAGGCRASRRVARTSRPRQDGARRRSCPGRRGLASAAARRRARPGTRWSGT